MPPAAKTLCKPNLHYRPPPRAERAGGARNSHGGFEWGCHRCPWAAPKFPAMLCWGRANHMKTMKILTCTGRVRCAGARVRCAGARVRCADARVGCAGARVGCAGARVGCAGARRGGVRGCGVRVRGCGVRVCGCSNPGTYSNSGTYSSSVGSGVLKSRHVFEFGLKMGASRNGGRPSCHRPVQLLRRRPRSKVMPGAPDVATSPPAPMPPCGRALA